MIEKVLERLGKERVNSNVPTDVDFWSYLRAVSKCEEIVQEVAKEYGKDTNVLGKWIPCSERLPDTSNWDASTIRKLFLVSYEPDPVSKLWVGIRYFNKGTNKFGGDEKVIAWQPLPAPYQKGE